MRRRDETDAVKLLQRELDLNRVAIAKGLASSIKGAEIDHRIDRLIEHLTDNSSALRFISSFLKARPPFL